MFAGGFGVRELGSTTPVDADTLFMIASNTKALTTLMLAKLVDEGKLTWETPVTTPAAVVQAGRRRHHEPRAGQAPDLRLHRPAAPGLRVAVPVRGRDAGERARDARARCSRPASSASCSSTRTRWPAPPASSAATCSIPKLELGAAYDEAMQTQVFDPLGMTATTFDFARALAGNHAAAHAPDIDGKPARRGDGAQLLDHPAAPGRRRLEQRRATCSSTSQMELAEGALPDGTALHRARRRCSRGARRRCRSARTRPTAWGSSVDTTYGVPVVHHGGDMIGYHSDMIWLPEHNVGAVILTNGDPGLAAPQQLPPQAARGAVRRPPGSRRRPGRRAAKTFFEQLAAERKLLTVPADAAEAAKLARALREPGARRDRRQPRRGSDRLRLRRVEERGGLPPATRTARSRSSPPRPASAASSSSSAPAPKRTLVTRDAQHEYVFEER